MPTVSTNVEAPTVSDHYLDQSQAFGVECLLALPKLKLLLSLQLEQFHFRDLLHFTAAAAPVSRSIRGLQFYCRRISLTSSTAKNSSAPRPTTGLRFCYCSAVPVVFVPPPSLLPPMFSGYCSSTCCSTCCRYQGRVSSCLC